MKAAIVLIPLLFSGCVSLKSSDSNSFSESIKFESTINRTHSYNGSILKTGLFKAQTDSIFSIYVSNPYKTSLTVESVGLYGAVGNSCYIFSEPKLIVPASSTILFDSVSIDSIEKCITKMFLSKSKPSMIVANGRAAPPNKANSSSQSKGVAINLKYSNKTNGGEITSSSSIHYIW